MQSTISSKYRNQVKTLSFGLNKSAKFIPANSEPLVPLFCPICEQCLSSSIDEEAYLRVSCCRECECEFAEIDLPSWKEGIRPNKEEINKKLKQREALLFARYVIMEK